MHTMNKIIKTDLKEQLSQSFIDYGISVITDRAIPSVEDGLKPCLRRILWDMYNKNVVYSKPHQKSAKIVGSTMGSWHPHGDSSIYGALVNASQPWNMRYPLIDFHGNMGSRDGDGAASMRYTECRLNPLSEKTMEGLKKQVVNFQSNYSETENEPVYLPGMFPNLLCNGTTGIAVAMACNFLPHNLTEVMDTILARLKKEDNPLQYLTGPDFPTGGMIINKEDIPAIYTTGKGTVKVRGEYTIENNSIIFYSIPYKVSKEELLTSINELCENKELIGIKEVRDETNKKGVRFCIDCEPGVTNAVVQALFQKTKLQNSYSANQVALIDKSPKLLSTLEIIDFYIKHQKEVLRKEYLFDKEKLDARLIILEGLLKALEDIDNIIKIIKSSKSSAQAEENLCKTYNFIPAQAKAIIDMKLGKLASLESIKIEKEQEEKLKLQKTLVFLLENQDAFDKSLIDRLIEFKKQFGDTRRTSLNQITIIKEQKEKEEVKLEDVVIGFTNTNFLKRTKIESQKRNGKGKKVSAEFNVSTFKTDTLSTLMIFTTAGKMYQIAVKDIPKEPSGVSIFELLELTVGEEIKCIIPLNNIENKKVLFLTKQGRIKMSELSEYITTRKKKGILALKLKENDTVVDVKIVEPEDKKIIIYSNNKAINIDLNLIPVHGRAAQGVIGLKLKENDFALGVVVTKGEKIIVVSCQNTAKVLDLKNDEALSSSQVRGGVGKQFFPKGYTNLFFAEYIEDSFLNVSNFANEICISVKEIPVQNICAQGVVLIKNSKTDLKNADLIF